MHWLTLVLIPSDTQDVEEKVAELLSPPQEREFPEYPVACACIGSVARIHGYDAVDQTPDGKELLKRLQDARSTGDQTTKAQVLRQRSDAADAVARTHLLYRKPDPDCDVCPGTGVWLASRNPAEHWDYWSIGGRWDGVLLGKPRGDDVDGTMRLDDNCVPVTQLPPGLMPPAIVTPDGLWHENPQWDPAWPFPEGRQDWHDEVRELLQRYQHCLTVAVDCHS